MTFLRPRDYEPELMLKLGPALNQVIQLIIQLHQRFFLEKFSAETRERFQIFDTVIPESWQGKFDESSLWKEITIMNTPPVTSPVTSSAPSVTSHENEGSETKTRLKRALSNYATSFAKFIVKPTFLFEISLNFLFLFFFPAK
jgi:hypothetical protein